LLHLKIIPAGFTEFVKQFFKTIFFIFNKLKESAFNDNSMLESRNKIFYQAEG